MPPASESHVPVMAETALELMRIRPDGVYVDATSGAGGHGARIAAKLRGGRLISLDRDQEAVTMSAARLAPYSCATVVKANYSDLDEVLRDAGIAALDGVLFDLGVSSMQLDTASRGFSFQADGPLDMRMDNSAPTDAQAWLAGASREEIYSALRDYGDVGPAGRIADKIRARVACGQMTRTSDLAAAVTEALDFVSGTPVEVRTVFQAIRMAVNEELKHLDAGLRQAGAKLAPTGRIVAITFHSGEDRVVKQLFRAWTRPEVRLAPDGRVKEKRAPTMKLATRKPVLPTADEIARNPRSKSAKVRAVERILFAAAKGQEDINAAY